MPDDVSEWLEKLGLGQYAPDFTNNDIDTQHLRQLTNADLKELGISRVGRSQFRVLSYSPQSVLRHTNRTPRERLCKGPLLCLHQLGTYLRHPW